MRSLSQTLADFQSYQKYCNKCNKFYLAWGDKHVCDEVKQMAWNVSDDWQSHTATCPHCHARYHLADGDCDCRYCEICDKLVPPQERIGNVCLACVDGGCDEDLN